MARSNNPAFMESLLAEGMSPNARSHYQPIIFNALSEHSFKVLNLLVDSDADINARDTAGGTSIIEALAGMELEQVVYLLDNRTVTQLPDGRELKSLYYGSGHRMQINLGNRVISEITRDALHQEIRRSQGALNTEYVRDELGRLVTQRAARGGKLQEAREYGWRRNGELQQMVDLRSGEHRYQYDAAGRLIQAGAERFAFEPAHSLLSGSEEAPVRDNRICV